MRVAVIGGYGLIGGQVVAHLVAEGHGVLGIGRTVVEAARRFPGVAWCRIDMGRASATEWGRALAGCDAVVNCAGALQDGPADDLRAVHVEGLRQLLAGCGEAGVTQFIHISAAGVATGSGAFGTTKRQAEALLAQSGLVWTVLRPGLVLAPAAFGGSALLRALAAFPVVIPAIHADRVVQVVGAEDVAAAIGACLRPGVAEGQALDLVAAEETRLGDILRAMRGWLGLAPAPIFRAPGWLVGLAARGADALAWLGWRSPMRTTGIAQLAAGVRGQAGDAAALGLRLKGLAAWLTAHPAGVQDRWFARLYLAKPLVLLVLAVFWLASGLLGFAQVARAAAVLEEAGFGPGAARAAVLAGSLADVALGLLVLHRATARWALAGMIAVSAAYLLGATAWRPDLWLDPLGPLVKVMPGAMLAAVALGMIEER